MNVAKRLEELAGEGEILIDEETHGLVQGCVQTEHAEHQPARSGETIAALRLVARATRTPPGASRHSTPLSSAATGNSTRSLARLRPTVSDRACHLVTVLGAAGVGKSRLVGEFIDGLDDQATVLRGHCLPYGEGITYWPLAEVVTDIASLHGPAEPSASDDRRPARR